MNFDQVQTAIELVSDKHDGETTDYCIEFKDMYFSAVALGENLLQSINTQNGDTIQINSIGVEPTQQTNYSTSLCCNVIGRNLCTKFIGYV